ncbi:MAG: hypothetical protein ACR5KX_01985 [Wolbachia sp.]
MEPSEQFDVGEIKGQLLLNIRACLSYLFPRGTFHGDIFYIGNVQGNRGRSLKVELAYGKAGLWIDFATGEGDDIINLFAVIHGKNARTEFPQVMASISK